MEIFGLHKREFFLHLDFIKRYHNIDSANIYTTLLAPFSPIVASALIIIYITEYGNNWKQDEKNHQFQMTAKKL